MKASVYIETSIISYLVSRPSRDLVVAGHQQITHEWWHRRRHQFECFISEAVRKEADGGDPAEAQKRIDAIRDVALLEIPEAARELARRFLDQGVTAQRRHGCLARRYRDHDGHGFSRYLELHSHRERSGREEAGRSLPRQRVGSPDHLHTGAAMGD